MSEEYYRGYTSICSYIRKRNEHCSFREFIDLYRETIVESPPNTDNWYGLETAWETRFLRNVEDIIPEKYNNIYAKVKSETSNKSLMNYWQNIVNEKGRISVINTHISGSLKILDVTAKHNTDVIISKVSNLSSYEDQSRKRSLDNAGNNDVADTTIHYGKHPSKLMTDVLSTDSKRTRVETDESAGHNSEEIDTEVIEVEQDSKEIEDLSQDEVEIRNKLLDILVEFQNKEKKSGANYMSSVCLNGILDLSDEEVYKTVKKTLDMDQLNWLEKVIAKKNWKQTFEFAQYIGQFTEDACTRAEIPTIVRKSYVPGRFDPCYYEALDIAQQILTHFSVRLEAPMRVEYKGLDLERTFAIDTIVYILNRLFRMHQDELDVAWIEQTTPDTKDHKFDGLYKVIRTTGKGQVIIIIEFSYGRKAPLSKKDGDQLKLCRNSMRTLNKLLKTVPKDRARVYLVQSFDGFIKIKYLVRPIPSIYILQCFMCTKIPASFGDFEQFANDLKDLINWQVDVLSTVRAVNKAITADNTRVDNNLHITSVDDSPIKEKREK